jgi:putative FmdB family regulatory protein
MPTYEYQCQACGHAFEKFQPITDRPVRICPKCKRAKARRLISAGGGVIFKGSGFYQTDYRSKSYQEAARKESPSACDSCKLSDSCKNAASKNSGD